MWKYGFIAFLFFTQSAHAGDVQNPKPMEKTHIPTFEEALAMKPADFAKHMKNYEAEMTGNTDEMENRIPTFDEAKAMTPAEFEGHLSKDSTY